MRQDRVTRIARPSVALAVLALALVVLGLALAGPPAHASGAIVRSGGAAVQFGEDVYVGRRPPGAVGGRVRRRHHRGRHGARTRSSRSAAT